jgi:hypothetical protein
LTGQEPLGPAALVLTATVARRYYLAAAPSCADEHGGDGCGRARR